MFLSRRSFQNRLFHLISRASNSDNDPMSSPPPSAESAATRTRAIRCDELPKAVGASQASIHGVIKKTCQLYGEWLDLIPVMAPINAAREWMAMYATSDEFSGDLEHGSFDFLERAAERIIGALTHVAQRLPKSSEYMTVSLKWIVSDPRGRSRTRGGATPSFGSAFRECRAPLLLKPFFDLCVASEINSPTVLRTLLSGQGHDAVLGKLVPLAEEQPGNSDDWLDLTQAAKLMGVKKDTFSNWVSSGKIPPSVIQAKPNRHRRFSRKGLLLHKGSKD